MKIITKELIMFRNCLRAHTAKKEFNYGLLRADTHKNQVVIQPRHTQIKKLLKGTRKI